MSCHYLTAVICRWLSPACRDVGFGVSSIKKSLKPRESMVGSTLLAKGASGNYPIHHNYTFWTLPHRGQGTQILQWPHWIRLWRWREGGMEKTNGWRVQKVLGLKTARQMERNKPRVKYWENTRSKGNSWERGRLQDMMKEKSKKRGKREWPHLSAVYQWRKAAVIK